MSYDWLRILCVEDEKDARELYRETLNLVFPVVETAEDGVAGLQKVESFHPHIVISDIRMPNMNGLEMAKEIKEKSPDTIIVIASAHSEGEYLFEAIQCGVDGFINKPVQMSNLISKIRKFADQLYQNEQYLTTKQLLEEYKEAVDESMLVSKTDLKGNITYVNDAFVEISGFTREELMGRNHRIVRHPDMPDELFSDMWTTITAGNTWKGVLKNRTRGEGYYIVDAVVKPIVDREGSIQEFISMRRDITEQEEYRQYLQKQLGTQDSDVREKLELLTQYENAVEISTAFCRSDLDDYITYVNETFCKAMGYSPEELVGMHKNDLIQERSGGEFNKDSMSYWNGRLQVVCKDGSPRYLNTTMVPIYDSQHNVKEHMSISHDVTTAVELQVEIEATQREFLYRLGEIAEMRSRETGQHVRRVAHFSAALARARGLSKEDRELLELVSPMHDAGKIAIPDQILNKPGALTEEEFTIMKTHASIGYEMFKDSGKEVLQAAALVAHTHHEKWNGSGYPNGLAGEEIPLFGRIVAIADVYDALGCDRVYKKAWEHEKIIDFFKAQSGVHFDPVLIELFFEIMPEILKIKETYAD